MPMLDTHRAETAQSLSHQGFPSENLPLEVEGLSYRRENRSLLSGINVKLENPKRTIIMGPNGAGKSLFLRIIHGLIKPTSGEVRWGGEVIDDQARLRQALVFQRPVLLRRSVAANIDFILSLRGRSNEQKRDHLLDRVSLSDFADQPARRLSGGEQQRLALARSLALEPDVLMLDEPTANLDPSSVLMIEEIVNEVCRAGTKIIFVTHDLAQARRLGDEIMFMHKGRILELTDADTFFDNPKSADAGDFLTGKLLT